MRPDLLPIPTEKVKEIERLGKLGLSLNDISVILDVSIGTVSNYLIKAGIRKINKNKSRRGNFTLHKNYNWSNYILHNGLPGVYIIRNKINNFVYIGSTSNLYQRLYLHYTRLLKGKHENCKIHSEYEKYGIDCFEIGLIQICASTEEAVFIESDLIIKQNINLLYNSIYSLGKHYPITDNLTKSLWSKTIKQDDGCWIFTGRKHKGYGELEYYIPISERGNRKSKSKRLSAHKYSYVLNKGKVPPGLVVAHKCNNKLCVNPEHLEAITIKQNIADNRALYVN